MTEQLETIARPTDVMSVGEARTRAGVYALGAMEQQEFDTNLALLKRGMERLDRIIRDVLVPGTDYDEPHYAGTYKDASGGEHRKKNLLAAGAEKLCMMMRLVPTYEVIREVGEGNVTPVVSYMVTCLLHLGDASGAVAGTGVGSANTSEKKYKYRMGERACPVCGVVGSIRKSKWADKNVARWWYCMDCRREFGKDDRSIVEQRVGMVVNPDPFDLDNVILKMGKVRSFRDAVKSVTGGSARLTQDMEEPAVAAMAEEETEEPKPEPEPKPKPMAKQPEPRARTEREELVTQLFLKAKDRGLTKVGDVFADIQTFGGLSETVVLNTVSDVPSDAIQRTLDAWASEAAAAEEGISG